MLFSYNWLQEYFDEKLPQAEDLAILLGKHSFEIEGLEKLDDDYLIDADVLPNRAHDCLSYDGMAREISTLTNLALQAPSDTLGAWSAKLVTKIKTADFISLEVENDVVETKDCPRAMKRFATAVKVSPSPEWLVEKLALMGQKSINNVVDITNLVTIETGQPVHCFDYDKLAKNTGENKVSICVRFAKKGEKIITLDDKKYILDETMLVIADNEKTLDIAGIKGGAISGIDAKTKNIVLSVCNFNHVNIRKTSKKLNLRTDASARFENEISPEKTVQAMERLSQLMAELAGGEIAEDVLDIYPRKTPKYKVGVSVNEVNKLLGTKITEAEITDIFSRMGVVFEKVKPLDKILKLAKILEGKPYQYGASVSYDAPNAFDCSSFTAYLFAQAGIAIPRMSIDQYFFGEEVSEGDLEIGDLVFSNTKHGKIYYESLEWIQELKEEKGIDHIGVYLGSGKIIHASRTNGKSGQVLTEDLKIAKQFKNITGYKRILDNRERFVVEIPSERLDLRIKEDLIEEIGRIYGYENIKGEFPTGFFNPPKLHKIYQYADKIRDIMIGAGFSETYGYTLAKAGEVELANPFTVEKGFLRTNLLKGLETAAKENLRYFNEVKLFEIGKIFWKEKSGVGERFSFAAVTARDKIKNPDELFYSVKGVVELIIKELGIKKYLFQKDPTDRFVALIKVGDGDDKIDLALGQLTLNGFEINLECLVKYAEDLKIYKTPSKYPFISRDIALFVGSETQVAEVEQVIRKSVGDLMVNLELFDIFQKPGEDKKSLAFRLTFQSREKTLSDEEVNILNNKIVANLEKKSNWEVRK